MIQKRFYEDYPPHPKEKEYNYKCSSTMKPTQMSVRCFNRPDLPLNYSTYAHAARSSLRRNSCLFREPQSLELKPPRRQMLFAEKKMCLSSIPLSRARALSNPSHTSATLPPSFHSLYTCTPLKLRLVTPDNTTCCQCANGSINQIPPHATVSGDCRVTPFYGVDKVQRAAWDEAAEICIIGGRGSGATGVKSLGWVF